MAPAQGPLWQVRGRGDRPREQRWWGRGALVSLPLSQGRGGGAFNSTRGAEGPDLLGDFGAVPCLGIRRSQWPPPDQSKFSSSHIPQPPALKVSTSSPPTRTLPLGSPEKESVEIRKSRRSARMGAEAGS